MPALDLRTLILIYVGVRIGQALVLAYLWSVQRSYPPAKDWAVGAFLSAAGLFFLALRGVAPVWVSEVLANALLLPGWMIFDYGIVKAAGKKPPVKLGLLICAVLFCLPLWHRFMFLDWIARITSHHLILGIFDLYACYACLAVSKNSRTITFRLIATLLLLSGVSLLWRALGSAYGLVLPFPWFPLRTLLVATSILIFPMITMLLALQTSQRLQDEINDQARRDMLTGAFNRRAFDESVNREWSRSLRHGAPFSLLMVDIDHFKKVNDQWGHHVGDAALVQMSNSAQTALRANDIWCRYGGEEFAVLLPDTTIEQAVTVAERLRSSVEKSPLAIPGGWLTVSVSIGVAERTPLHAHWTEVLSISDAALYKAKATGRNRVIAGDSSVNA
jgi:diguanylate cyclase (GGDEF)-like protein